MKEEISNIDDMKIAPPTPWSFELSDEVLKKLDRFEKHTNKMERLQEFLNKNIGTIRYSYSHASNICPPPEYAARRDKLLDDMCKFLISLSEIMEDFESDE